MSVNTIPFLDPSNVPTPPAGSFQLFYDTSNGNVLTFKDSQGNLCPLNQLAAPAVDVNAITDCICKVLEESTNDLSCAAAKGVITMAEFESWQQNFNMFSSVTIDPSTGSFVHGITSQAVLFVQLTKTDVLCNGDSTGTASAVVTGGAQPYTLVWEDLVPAVVNPAALAAGAYTLTVTDSNNITKVLAFVIGEPAALGLSVGVSGVSPNASAAANVTGGTQPYTYEWRDNGGVPIGQTTQVATGLVSGTYQVHVTDANGCLINDNAVVIP